MRTYGAIDLQTMRHVGADFETSRPMAELRRPRGLPLPFVELHVPITADDLTPGAPWPPSRGWARANRLTQQWEATRGNYTTWMPEYDFDVSLNPISAYIDDVRAIMMSSHPAEGSELTLRRSIRKAIGKAVFDLLTHGKTLVVGSEGVAQTMPIRYAWPYADQSGWSIVVPVVTSTRSNGDGKFDAVDVWTIADGQLGGYRAQLDSNSEAQSYGTLGPVLDTYDAVPAMWAEADRPHVEFMWGQPHVDDLIPIAVAMARRESGADYALDRFETPHYEIDQALADAGVNYPGLDSTTDSRALTPEQFRSFVPSLNEHDVVVIQDGRSSGRFVQAQLSTQDSLAFLMRLDQRWTEQTGVRLIQPEGVGEVDSGIAFAQKNERLVARSRELHEAIKDALTVVVGAFDWEYVGTMGGAPETEANPQPEVETEDV